jgi:hypothetical protein
VSKYRKMQTKFTSRALMREALKAAGMDFEECQPGTEKHLVGYQGKVRDETATFIVRREHISRSSNDLGWHWNPTTRCFEEIVSEYDSRETNTTRIRKTVKREYAVAATMSQARAKGYRVVRQNQANGTVQLVVTGRI